MAVIYIVILIGVLVFVHEFGHYLAARLFNVKVLSFSIGFGPKLASFKRGDTNWDIRLLPLGGFVEMYGTEFSEVETEEEDSDRAYNNKPIWQKAIINFAGPLFNLLLPLPILFCVYFATVTETYPAQIGTIMDDSPAASMLLPGDKVTAINGSNVRYWYELHDIVADHPNVPLDFTIDRAGQELHFEITPAAVELRDEMDVMRNTVGRVGLTLNQAVPMIGITDPRKPAAVAGLQNFDEIIAVNGTPVATYIELAASIRSATTNKFEFDVLRPTEIDVEYGSISLLVPQKITIDSNDHDPEALGFASAATFITQVDPDSPAAQAGLQAGDQILAHNGTAVTFIDSTLDNMAQKYEDVHTLTVRRDGNTFDTKIQLQRLMITGEFQEELPTIYAGMYNSVSSNLPARIEKPLADRFTFAASESLSTTVNASTMLVVYIARMFQGRVSTKQLGGPILIGHMAQKAGEQGAPSFFTMLALISINLGIVNLVPIPLLDGGKLFILLIEAIKHGPLSMRTRQIVAYIGLAMVFLLMILAFKNDIERLWNMFFD